MDSKLINQFIDQLKSDTIDKTITQAIKKRKNIDSETLMLAFTRKAVR